MTDVVIGSGASTKSLGGYTMFVNLMRGSKHRTRMNWKPFDQAQQPIFTPDYSGLVCSLDLTGLPDDLKPNSKYTVPLDCSIAPVGNWVLASPTHQLCDLFQVSTASLYPPGTRGAEPVIPQVFLVAKHGCKKADIPSAAVYLCLLA